MGQTKVNLKRLDICPVHSENFFIGDISLNLKVSDNTPNQEEIDYILAILEGKFDH